MAVSLAERSNLVRYAFCAVIVAAAAGLHWAIQPMIGPRVPFLFFQPAVLLTAMFVGRGPAVVVLVAGAINSAYLLPPVGSPQIAALEDVAALFAYALVGALLVYVGVYLRRNTQRAQSAERRLVLAQENTGVGLFEIDLVERTIFASAALRKLFGREATGREFHSQMALDEWNATLDAEELREARTLLKKKLAEGVEVYEREHRILLPDGAERWLFTKIHIERNAGGRPVRLRGASLDITDSKRVRELLQQAQGELRQQIADLRRLHELSSRLPEIGNLRNQLQAILEALAAFHGSGLGLVALYDARNTLAVAANLGFGRDAQRLLACMAVVGGACENTIKSGQRLVVEDTESNPCFAPFRNLARQDGFRAIHSTPLVSADGSVLGMIAVYFRETRQPNERENRLSDICARKAAVFVERARAQEVAQESDQRFRIAIEASAVPFTVLSPVRDDDGRIVDFRWQYLNNAGSQALGRSPAALAGKCISEDLPGIWEEPGLLARYAAVVESGQPQEFERCSPVNGFSSWFHVVASPMQGSIALWFADITERKHHEQILREADRRKDEFLATLAHELRNPLAPIRQAALISKAAGATEAQKNWSHDVIERQVTHMALLLDDLLDVSRITRGMLQLRKARTDLALVIDLALETARPLIDARQHKLVLDLPSVPVCFEADQLRVAQIIGNLLTNAAKYTDDGGIIKLSAAVDSGEVEIAITDNGIGLRKEALTEIFEMFNQVRTTQDRSNGGLGIGLALARGLAELHGGRIEASSAGPGMGSSFALRLPMQTVRSDAEPGAVVPVRSVARRRVLVVDDNRDAADTLAEFLQLEGHEVRVAYESDSALTEFVSFRPDVALLDIGLPRMSGNEVARRIRAMPLAAAVTLIAVTGWGQDKDKQRALEAGFDHHLTKPIDLHRLALLLTEPSAPVLSSAARPRVVGG